LVSACAVDSETPYDRKLIQAMLKSAKAWEEAEKERGKEKSKKPRE
jgi:hypothetical protein